MSSPPPATFATLLRRYRLAAGLTQGELAERAQLSREAIGALERGTRQAPRKETIDLLAEALALTEPERAAFEAAARQHRAANKPATSPPAPAVAPPEAAAPPEAGLRPPAGGRALAHVVHSPPSISLRRLGTVAVGLACLLLVGTSLLAGSHFPSGGETLCLASDLPTSGDYWTYGDTEPVLYAIDLAGAQNRDLGSGYTLKVINYDDASPDTRNYDPQIGAHNVQQMVRNPCIVGIVGPYNTDVAAAEMPIAASAGMVMVSPSTTRSGLTLRPYAELEGWDFDQLHPVGKPLSFFRVVPNDLAQGVVAADFAYEDLGARNVYVVSDSEPFGEDLLGGFTQGFQVRGGRIVGTDSIANEDASAIADVATRIAAANPDAVYYAGATYEGGGLLRAELVRRGYTGPFVGGDAIALDPVFVEDAGGAVADGVWAVQSSAHPSSASSGEAARFFRAFHARYPGQVINPDTAEAYDAAMVLITAIKHLVQSGQPVTRAALIEQVQHIQYAGVIGPISFDGNGDIDHGVFSLYRVDDGAWDFIRQLSG